MSVLVTDTAFFFQGYPPYSHFSFFDDLHNLGIYQGGDISKIGPVAIRDGAKDAPHDLAGTRLG